MPSCVDVENWRLPSKEEHLAYIDSFRNRNDSPGQRNSRKRNSGLLAVRSRISMVDIYCYLKARFGEPNGFQTLLKDPKTSDNLIHWDFNLACRGKIFNISGFSREFHILVQEKMRDDDWNKLIDNIKLDFRRLGKEKSGILASLEEWTTFANKFVSIANNCANIHERLSNCLNGISGTDATQKPRKKKLSKRFAGYDDSATRLNTLLDTTLILSLLTPVLAEAFINMIALIICKEDIRNNKRQYESFLHQQIDTKVYDLPYKCHSFAKNVDQKREEVKNFKRVMDKRNNAIHGNVDPVKDQVEKVYFDSLIPLFKETGDHMDHYFKKIEGLLEAERVISDYENMHLFFGYILNLLEETTRDTFIQILEDPYPGYRLDKKRFGAILPDRVIGSYLNRIKYDDELSEVSIRSRLEQG